MSKFDCDDDADGGGVNGNVMPVMMGIKFFRIGMLMVRW